MARREVEADSVSSVKGLYSIWTAAIGWTAWARRSVLDEHSERPRWRTLPALWVEAEGGLVLGMQRGSSGRERGGRGEGAT